MPRRIHLHLVLLLTIASCTSSARLPAVEPTPAGFPRALECTIVWQEGPGKQGEGTIRSYAMHSADSTRFERELIVSFTRVGLMYDIRDSFHQPGLIVVVDARLDSSGRLAGIRRRAESDTAKTRAARTPQEAAEAMRFHPPVALNASELNELETLGRWLWNRPCRPPY